MTNLHFRCIVKKSQQVAFAAGRGYDGPYQAALRSMTRLRRAGMEPRAACARTTRRPSCRCTRCVPLYPRGSCACLSRRPLRLMRLFIPPAPLLRPPVPLPAPGRHVSPCRLCARLMRPPHILPLRLRVIPRHSAAYPLPPLRALARPALAAKILMEFLSAAPAKCCVTAITLT